MRSIACFLSLLVCVSVSAQERHEGNAKDQQLAFVGVFDDPIPNSKPRVIVLTDITNEPDDQQSLVRFLVYSNEYDVEGLIATTSTWLRDKTSSKNIRLCVDAYGKVLPQLAKHATGFPSAKFLQDRIKDGLVKYGMTGVGEGNDSEGSRHIIKVVDADDPRPIWVTAWGGTNCLAQALWRIKEDRSEVEVEKFVAKLRVYAISDQDDSGEWLRRTFPKLFYVVSPSGQSFKDYYRATWTGISGDVFFMNGPGYHKELVSNDWLKQNIRENHGPLGELYPPIEYMMEGDTPSFFSLINNGLGSHVSPGYGGWGGRYEFRKVAAGNGPIWTDGRDAVTLPGGKTYASGQATIWRWRVAYQHDFAARMDWTVKDPSETNHNPVVVVEGDKTKKVLHRNVSAGQQVTLSAEGTSDPDGNKLTYRWFHYPEAEYDVAHERRAWSIELTGADTDKVSFEVPKARYDHNKIHIILDVSDDGDPSLHAYRRIVFTVDGSK